MVEAGREILPAVALDHAERRTEAVDDVIGGQPGLDRGVIQVIDHEPAVRQVAIEADAAVSPPSARAHSPWNQR